jgi:twitching motility protein PilU
MAMERLLTLMAEKKASDLFLAPGSPIHLKINGVSVPVGQQKMDPTAVKALLREIIPEDKWEQYEKTRELNTGYGLRGVGSFRLSVFQQRGSPAAVVRYIPSDIPEFESLHLPPVLTELIMDKRGLILVVGATGSGKSTTLASMLDFRNERRSGHILTMEDPIEFIYRNKKSIVNQREIGNDAESLHIALKNAMRQAPDCVMIGEIRDAETMSAALAYAQSGHLVVSTLHANNSYHALNRVISFYPPENRRTLLGDLSTSLRCVMSQRLIRAQTGGRIPAAEILLNTSHISELIAEARISEIKEAMEKSLAPGSQTFDQSLVRLVRDQRIAKEDAIANADSATNLLWLLDNLPTGPAVSTSSLGSSLPPMSMPATLSNTAPAPQAPGQTPLPGAPAGSDKKAETATFSEFLLNI